jgi:hypothetical protein
VRGWGASPGAYLNNVALLDSFRRLRQIFSPWFRHGPGHGCRPAEHYPAARAGCADAPRPAKLGGNINSLTAGHDHIARRHPQMSVLAASTLHHINGTDRKGSRQVARLTVCWKAHRFLHGNNLEVKCDHICQVPRAAAFRQNGLWITVDNLAYQRLAGRTQTC